MRPRAKRKTELSHIGLLEVISWSEARARDLKRYYTGKRCKNGHLAERRVINSNCVACNPEYYHTYYAKNGKTPRKVA
jgi:hypothetical protein